MYTTSGDLPIKSGTLHCFSLHQPILSRYLPQLIHFREPCMYTHTHITHSHTHAKMATSVVRRSGICTHV